MSAALRTRARLGLALIALAAAGIAPAQPPSPAAIPAEFRAYVPSNLAGYFLAFLMAPAERRPMTRELFIRHQAYIRHQFEAGAYRLAGPLTDGGAIAGIVVVSAPTREAALALVSADPAVQEGGFRIELHTALFPDLSAVRAEYPPSPTH